MREARRSWLPRPLKYDSDLNIHRTINAGGAPGSNLKNHDVTVMLCNKRNRVVRFNQSNGGNESLSL